MCKRLNKTGLLFDSQWRKEESRIGIPCLNREFVRDLEQRESLSVPLWIDSLCGSEASEGCWVSEGIIQARELITTWPSELSHPASFNRTTATLSVIKRLNLTTKLLYQLYRPITELNAQAGNIWFDFSGFVSFSVLVCKILTYCILYFAIVGLKLRSYKSKIFIKSFLIQFRKKCCVLLKYDG